MCEEDVIPIESKYAIGIDIKKVPQLMSTLENKSKLAKKQNKRVGLNNKRLNTLSKPQRRREAQPKL